MGFFAPPPTDLDVVWYPSQGPLLFSLVIKLVISSQGPYKHSQ